MNTFSGSVRSFCLFLIWISFLLHCSNGCIESERLALLAFKKSFVDHEKVLASWTRRNKDCCGWSRVGCNNLTGHVIKLNLGGSYDGWLDHRGFRGVSSSLLRLPYLSHLNLSYNSFTRVPKTISSLHNLTYLDMSYNDLSGTFPYHIGNLSKLEYFDYTFNDLITSDNLEWLANLSSLRTLVLSSVNFTKAENWFQIIKMHPSLSSLQLSFCYFPEAKAPPTSFNSSNSVFEIQFWRNTFETPLLSWVFNLSTSLVTLVANDGGLTGSIPSSIGDMISLEGLYLSDNLIEGEIPSSFNKLCRLKYLDLKSNALSASLNDILRTLSCAKKSLEMLVLSNNQLTGSLSEISEFESLTVLDVSDNQLTGTLVNLDKLMSLETLYLRNNSFSGSLPTSVSKMSNLTHLDVSSNSMHGFVSQEHLSSLSKLLELGLSDNNFTFTTSSNWVPPFQLDTIKLRSCKVGPEFPQWIRTQDNLSWLDISNSEISDAIPTWIWNFTSTITYWNLSFNHIYGQIPNLPLEFSDFPGIDLSSNSLHGPIPHFLSHTGSLNLARNNFSGNLSFLCSKTTTYNVMTFLDLSDNQLSGTLPKCMFKLGSLEIVNLGGNNLFGAIPNSIGFLDMLETLRLSRNNFTGDLPSSMRDCTNLKFLDIGENKLSGEVPSWIGESLVSLVVLRLRSNELRGNIPSEICYLESLQILDLAINNISGSIPTCLNNLTAMVSTQIIDTKLSYEFNAAAARPESEDEFYEVFFPSLYFDYTWILWKGFEREYGKTLGLLRIIDVSSNNLIGDIPSEVSELLGLKSLNLSRNHLSGMIPDNIGRLQSLEVLDLSHNKISGKVPGSLAEMTFLNKLDLSYNELSGRIPTSTQLQTFGSSSYEGNIGLCGCPLSVKCSGDSNECVVDRTRQEDPTRVIRIDSDENERFFESSSLYGGLVVGFGVGFSGFCCFLMMNSSWRVGYFGLLNRIGDWLYLFMALKIARCCNAAR